MNTSGAVWRTPCLFDSITKGTRCKMKTWIYGENGNRASVERWGSEEAARQSLTSLKHCLRCSDCSDCVGCWDCLHCSGCLYCSDCSDCSDCSYCSGCSDCL